MEEPKKSELFKNEIKKKDEENNESFLNTPNKNNSLPKHEFFVKDYDDSCEEFSKISKILSLRKNSFKYCIFIIFSIFTLGILNIIVSWFPILKKYLIYSVCELEKATHFGLLGGDKKFYITESINMNLPDISKSHLRKYCDFSVENNNIKLFEHRLYKYLYLDTEDCFVYLKFSIKTTHENIHNYFTNGLNEDEKNHLRSIFGICDLEINIDSVFKLLFNEISDPFYLFQVFSIALWFSNQYETYAAVIVVTSFISIGISVYEIRVNLQKIQKMAKYSCDVNITRKGKDGEKFQLSIKSDELLPGDLFELPEDEKALPCDCILINGSVIINESMLTGESTPIIKSHILHSNKSFNANLDSNHILYAGTKIVQKRAIGGCKILAIVISTGFNTRKGVLIRTILFPNESDSKFKQDSIKFIFLLAIMSLIFYFITLPFLIRSKLDTWRIIYNFLNLATCTVPPALPTCIGIGISYALSRLKKSGISCISRNRVNVAGKVNMICFDKTGTLTEDYLDIFGFRTVTFKNKSFEFDNFKDNIEEIVEENFNYYKERMNNKDNPNWKLNKSKDIRSYLVENLATCHSLTKVNDKIMGDPIDIKMFESTGWVLNENLENEENYDPLITTIVRPKNEIDLKEKISKVAAHEEDFVTQSHYEIGIIKRFEFSSKLMRMSVLVSNTNEPFYKLYTKGTLLLNLGSPEKIKELCRPDTLPENFNYILSNYTAKGFRVLGLSMKKIKLDYKTSQKIEREKIETNMIFLGLLIVQNKVKAQTKPSIEILQNARIKMVMATGDNMLTAISVAKECSLIKSDIPIFMIEIDKDNKLVFNMVEMFLDDSEVRKTIRKFNKSIRYDSIHSSISKFANFFHADSISNNDHSESLIDQPYKEIELNNSIENNENFFHVDININQLIFNKADEGHVLAITGTTLEKIWRLHNQYNSSKNESLKIYNDIFRQILKNGAIYARMSPEHKTMLVESLKEEEFTVCMCGDGANDCGALRAADVGVSLSQEEASIAAHFTSNIPDISCLIKVLLEGKASLITSIQCFKYMMLYSLIQSFSITILLILNSFLSNNENLIIDMGFTYPLAILMARTEAYEKLTYHLPTGALISFPIICSIFFQTIVQFGCQYSVFLVLSFQPWYEPIINPVDSEIVPATIQNTSILYVSMLQYIITAIAFSISKPFKKSIYTNFFLSAYLIITISYCYYIIVKPDQWNKKILGLKEFPSEDFRYLIIIITLVNFMASYLIEKIIVPLISEAWKKRKIRNFLSQTKKQKNANLKKLYEIKVNI